MHAALGVGVVTLHSTAESAVQHMPHQDGPETARYNLYLAAKINATLPHHH